MSRLLMLAGMLLWRALVAAVVIVPVWAGLRACGVVR
jgi:hypothetical protein